MNSFFSLIRFTMVLELLSSCKEWILTTELKWVLSSEYWLLTSLLYQLQSCIVQSIVVDVSGSEYWLLTSLLYQLQSCIVQSIVMDVSGMCCQIHVADAGWADHRTWLDGASVSNSSLSLKPGDHLSGKPGNVGEFDSCQGSVREKLPKTVYC